LGRKGKNLSDIFVGVNIHEKGLISGQRTIELEVLATFATEKGEGKCAISGIQSQLYIYVKRGSVSELLVRELPRVL